MWLKTYREKLDKTQKWVSDTAGISRSYYVNIETGMRQPSPKVAKKIAKVLGFDWTLFYETPETEEKEG